MRTRGFTFLELVLVLVIISTLLALAAPDLRGWSKGSKLRDAQDDFISTTRLARALAISDGTTYQLTIDGRSRTYGLRKLQAQQYIPVQTSLGSDVMLPSGFSLVATDLKGTPIEKIEFFPDGHSDPARIQLNGESGYRATIESSTPADGFSALKASGQ